MYRQDYMAKHSSVCMCVGCKITRGDLAHRIVTESRYGDELEVAG